MTPAELDEAYARRKLGDRVARGLATAAVAVAFLPLIALFASVISRDM